jgi:hypothetical protein
MTDTLPVWSIAPNFESGMTETLEWLTVILRSPSGAEQRRRMRISPRRYLEYDVLVGGNARTLYDLLLKSLGGGNSFFHVPVWFDMFRLTDALSGTTISNIQPWSEYTAGGMLILYSDPFTFEVCTVLSANNTSIVLTQPPATTWPAGTRCMPLLTCRSETDPTNNKASGALLTATLRWLTVQANDYPQSALTWDIYLQQPVFDDEPNTADNLTHTYQRLDDILDNTFGLPTMTDTGGAGFDLRQMTWFLAGREAHARWRSKMYYLAGQTNPLWVPTFFHDLELALPVGATDTYISVGLCGYTLCGGSAVRGRQDIRIELWDGTRIYRRITQSGVAGTLEELSLAPLGVDIEPSDVMRISFMSYCRLSADTITVKHETDISGLTTATVLFRECIDALPVTGGGIIPGIPVRGIKSLRAGTQNAPQNVSMPATFTCLLFSLWLQPLDPWYANWGELMDTADDQPYGGVMFSTSNGNGSASTILQWGIGVNVPGFVGGNQFVKWTLPNWTAGTWHHVLGSLDVTTGVVQLYVDDLPYEHMGAMAPLRTDPISLNLGLMQMSVPLAQLNQGCQADAYFAVGDTFLDLSWSPNRRRFSTADGQPTDLLIDGSGPTGQSPAVWLTVRDGGVANDFLMNRGIGGSHFTSPIDAAFLCDDVIGPPVLLAIEGLESDYNVVLP